MYIFRDTVEAEVYTPDLPAEAMSVNGEFLENLINGYRTLYVQGRELLASDFTSSVVGAKHGETLHRRRFSSRSLVIGYQLIATDDYSFREAYIKLMDALNADTMLVVFNDEPDKFWHATYEEGDAPSPGRNAVTAEFKLRCFDPFKYSVYEGEVAPNLDDGSTIAVNYEGTIESHPKFKVVFSGDCGYVAFFDEDQHILQFGNPEEVDGSSEATSSVVFNTTFKQ